MSSPPDHSDIKKFVRHYTPDRVYYNGNTLFIETGVAHKRQVEKILADMIKSLNIPCAFKVNLVVSKPVDSSQVKYLGHAYVWVTNPTVYNILTGGNPDGTDRVSFSEDPDWTPPAIPFDDLKSSDIDDDKLRQMYIRPIIKTELPPLIDIPSYDYDDDQLAHLKKLAQKRGEDPDTVPTKGSIRIYRAYIKDVTPEYCAWTIMSLNVPGWLTKNHIKDIFRPYVSQNFYYDPSYRSDKPIRNDYPIVAFSEKYNCRAVYVSFHPNSMDASFALLMTKKITIVNPETGESANLTFNYFINRKG